jgi:RNA polymerase sigma-70 factor, ECF subfamily
MEGKMQTNTTVEKAEMGKQSQPFYSSENSDEELVRVFVEDHDEQAFNEIVNRYGDKIYRTALRITHNTSDAEDVLQKVFITLIEKLDTFHRESKFSTWLYRVAANASYIYLRDEKKHKNEVSLEEYVSHDEDGAFKGVEIKDWSDRPDEVLQSKEAMEIIEGAVNELPVAHRVVFHLRDVEGLTNHEVSKILGLPLPNVKSRVHRARLFLRDRLSDYFLEKGEER